MILREKAFGNQRVLSGFGEAERKDHWTSKKQGRHDEVWISGRILGLLSFSLGVSMVRV